MSEFCGAWKFVSCENFDAYLKELGINVVLRKLAPLANPTVIFSRSEDAGVPTELWTMRTETIVKSVNAHFRLDEPFTEKTIDDRIVESLFTLEEDDSKKRRRMLVHVQKDKQGRTSRIERVLEGDIMHVSMAVNGVVSKAVFKKVR